MGIPDTSDRKDNLIESLKAQITEMSVNHERELQVVFAEMEKLNRKSETFDNMRNEL